MGKKRSTEQVTKDVFTKAAGGSPCPWPPPDLCYLGFFEDCAQRAAQGQKQRKCSRCQLYVWPDEKKACDNKIKREKST